MKNKNNKKQIDALTKMFLKAPQSTLGIKKILKLDTSKGEAHALYKARKNMCHSGNIVQGGFITGWLDAVMALACMCKVGADTLVLSLEIKTTFIKKISHEQVLVIGNVIKTGKTIAFLEGKIVDTENNILAKGTQTVKLINNFYKI
tara:strand:+ start:1207 stop:1647 length:441 start_codon:yes stop_codon:yes gene_type:complete